MVFVRLCAKFFLVMSLSALVTIVLLTAHAFAEDCNKNGIPDTCDLNPAAAGCSAYTLVDTSVAGSESCAQAQTVKPGFFYKGSTAGKAHEGNATCAWSSSAGAVWYRVLIPASGFLHVSLGGTFTQPNGFNSVVSLYDACESGSKEFDCANDSGCREDPSTPATSFMDPAVGIAGTPGQAVYIRIGGAENTAPYKDEGEYLLFIGDRNMYPVCPSSTSGASSDCNANQIPDECDIAAGNAEDCNGNAVPDGCEKLIDCDGNGKADACENRVQIVLQDLDPTVGGDDSIYGTEGPLKKSRFATIFDLMGMSYSSEMSEPVETATEDYAGPDFECATCPGGTARPPFGMFLTEPRWESGSLPSGGVFHAKGTYHLFRPMAGGEEFRGDLLALDAVQCTMPSIASGSSGFFAQLKPVSGSTGPFEACFSFPLDTIWFVPALHVSGSYDADGVFAGKGLLDINNACPTYSKRVYVSGRFFTPQTCADCNRNGIGDAADIAAGTSKDVDGNSIPDECDATKGPDCFGVPGGSAQPDRCGVCNGDGQSYLECAQVDLSSSKIDASRALVKQSRYARRVIKEARGRSCTISLRQAKKLTATSLMIVNEWPSSVKWCANETFCTKTAISWGTAEQFQDNALALFKLSKRAVKCNVSLPIGGVCNGPIEICQKYVQNALKANQGSVKEARRLMQASLDATLTVPTSQSVCCDEVIPAAAAGGVR